MASYSSVLLLLCFMWSGALGSPSLLPSCSVITLSLHITIILILILILIITLTFFYIYIYNDTIQVHKVLDAVRKWVKIGPESFLNYLERNKIQPCADLTIQIKALKKKSARKKRHQEKLRAKKLENLPGLGEDDEYEEKENGGGARLAGEVGITFTDLSGWDPHLSMSRSPSKASEYVMGLICLGLDMASTLLLLSYFLLIAALQSLDLLLSYPTPTLASHITIMLIIALTSITFQPYPK